MASITPEQKNALTTAITSLVARIQASQLTELQINALIEAYVTGLIADDSTASAGTSTTELASVRAAYLAAKKALEDELAGNTAGLQTLADIGTAVSDNQTDIDSLTQTLAGFVNVFNYVGSVDGGVDEQNPFDLATLPADGKNSGDYYDVNVGGWFIITGVNVVPFEIATGNGIVFKADGDVKIFDNQLTNVTGTAEEISVTGNKETGFAIALAQELRDRLTALELAVGNPSGGEDTDLRSRLDVAAPGTAITLSQLNTNSLTELAALPLGTHVHTASLDELGLGVGDEKSVSVFSSVSGLVDGVIVNQTAAWGGKSATRQTDSRVTTAGTEPSIPYDDVYQSTDDLTITSSTGIIVTTPTRDGGYPVSLALNGTTNSVADGLVWGSGTLATAYIRMEFPTPVAVGSVYVQNMRSDTYASYTGTVEISDDGVTWTELGALDFSTALLTGQYVTPPTPVTTKFVQFRPLTSGNSGSVGRFEVQLTQVLWTDWAVPMDEIEELYEIITDTMNASAQP